ncbi:dehydrogenase [Streptomyces sp. NPDC002773]|uniref:dehydrogenase n=1 Tax=Streptomyces sp. NPDC002773 TaxID=3154430 RepID=UPI0033207D44
MSLLTDLSWTRTGDGGLRLHRERIGARGSLRVLRAGICGTDLQIQRGVRPDGASVLGHEGLAEHCAPDGPVRGVFNPVDSADQDRILGHSYDGVFRRRYPEAPGDLVRRSLVPARPDLVADLTVLAEPLGAVLYGWDLLGADGPAGTVGVWGSGTTAVLAALVGEIRGVSTVLVHPRRERLEYLRRREVLATTRLTGEAPGGGLTAAFVCLPREAAGEAFTQAALAVEEDAPVDLFGGFGTGTRHELTGDLDLNSVRRSNVCGVPRSGGARPVSLSSGKRIRLTGHRGTSPEHLLRAQDLLAACPERFGRVLSHVLSLEAAGPALRSMAADRPGRRLTGEHLKVLIDPTMPAGTTRAPDLLTTVADIPHHC